MFIHLCVYMETIAGTCVRVRLCVCVCARMCVCVCV